ncbi:kinase-like domain-containing protein [Cladorrhinum sp. PSN332]|nr:kinase-like domain-containing protein [Cladorrhinum sp. PSN332]
MADINIRRVERKRALRWVQRSDKDYFDYWRRGFYRQYNERQRRPQIAVLRFPTPGVWGGHKKLFNHQPFECDKPWDEAGPPDLKYQAQAAAAKLSKQMRPAGFKFIKILGWGGLGVCSLYEVDDGAGEKTRVVCKLDLDSRHNYIHREIKAHVATAGAKHVIQRVILQHHHTQIEQVTKQLRAFDPPPDNDPAKADADLNDFEVIDEAEDEEFEVLERKFVELDMKKDYKGSLDTHERVLFIEFMSRGRFDDYIGKVAQQKSEFPDQVLWQVFDCLFRAVIGMAYPNSFQPVGSDPRTEHIPPISETSRGLPVLDSRSRMQRIIHFDLEPLNILVDGFDQDEHNIVPLIKVSDLGLAKMTNGRETDALKIWATRRSGKYHIYPPEQHTIEWDYIDELPNLRISETAGNYNWWTNLYQVALVMWKLITLCEYEYPPVIEELAIMQTDGTLTKEWTYGGHLFNPKFDNIDVDLRNLIAMCMIHNPTHRPTMEDIELSIRNHLDNDKTAGDPMVRTWVQDYFGGAPPPQRVPDPVDPRSYENLRGWKIEPKKDQTLANQRIASKKNKTALELLADKFSGWGF